MKRAVGSIFCACVLLAVTAGSAHAAFGLNGFQFEMESQVGQPASAAGSHPYGVTTSFHFNTVPGDPSTPDEQIRNLEVELPTGFAGAPSAVPACSHADFFQFVPETEDVLCSDESAVGVAFVEFNNPGEGAPRPVYNLDPPPGVVAQLGFVVVRNPVIVDFRVNDSFPYNVIAKLVNTPQVVKLFGSQLEIWGVPADPSHDEDRGNCVRTPGSKCSTSAEEEAFVTLPRACEGPLPTTYSALSWQGSADSGADPSPLETEDCASLEFDPQIDAAPTATAADSPTGLDFTLSVDDPGLTEPDGRAASDIEKAVVTLPAGVTTNPAVASGLQACSLAQYEAESLDPDTGCPAASKIGEVEVETPLLEGQVILGSIFVAAQKDNPFGNLLAIYMVIEDPELGLVVKQAGRVDPDPVTGQLTTTFDRLPQLPFSEFRLHFSSGDDSPLVTPPTCGSYETEAVLFPYAEGLEPVTRTASFEIDSGAGGSACATSPSQLPNSPSFTAGTVDPTAGTFSPFVLKLDRSDGSQPLSKLSTTLPQGLLGKLAGVPYCSEAQIAAAAARGGEGSAALEAAMPSCPSASQVGRVTVGAGAGSQLLYVQGKAYLAGPYKGAPLSLAIVTPALAGPFDLGTVVVRTPLRVNPVTTEITAESDPIPTILHGLPLGVRSLAVVMDRSQFTLNPTDCGPKSILGTMTSTFGSVAPLSQYFQATACGRLKFSPRLKLSLRGKTKRTGNPALRAVLTQPPGQAGIGGVSTVLPRVLFIDNSHITNPCTRVQFAAGSCPPKSVLGQATAWSPLLDEPLSGPVYFRSNGGERELPDLVAVLRGQIEVELVGFIDSVRKKGTDISRLRTRFQNVPDAPVSKFVLSLAGGSRGLLENSANLCRSNTKVTIAFTAQNDKISLQEPKMSVPCGKKKGK